MAHPSDAVDYLLVRGLLDPRQNGPKVLHSNKSSAAFSRFLAGVVYSAPCHPLLDPPIAASLALDKDATFVPTGCRQATMDGRLRHARIRPCPLKAPLKKLAHLFRLARPNLRSPALWSVLSSIASASSATICSASLPTGLMPSSAPSVTKADFTKLTPYCSMPRY